VAHSQGIGALEEICKDKPDDVSVVVLTGQDDQAMAVRALQRGAEDYLVKGGTPDNTAGRAVRYAIERKRAAEAMLASEKRLALAVDAAQMGIVDWNLQTGKITGSRHHARLFGQVFENGDCFADEYERCIHPDDRESVRNAIQHSLATREEYHQEFRVIWPGGSEHWIESRGRVFDDEHGHPLQLLGTVVDISQRKAAELAARIREGELAHLSRITTVGQMASGLAHELNQPLAAILNYASVCMDHLESRTGSPSTAQTAIGEVMNETRRAGAIINRMRFFVRKQEPQSAPLDINERVRESG
jgi:PAS domain S-box-containing protein